MDIGELGHQFPVADASIRSHIYNKERKMKRTNKEKRTRVAALALALVLSSAWFAGCASEENEEQISTRPPLSQGTSAIEQDAVTEGEDQNKPSSNIGSQDIEKDKYEEQISYYMELTESLQAQLLALKEQSYIDECEYKLQISSLEQNIKALQTMMQSYNKYPSSGEQIKPTPNQTSSQSKFEYSTQNSEVTISAYKGNDTEIVIPSVIDGLPVTKIGQSAFEGKAVTSVVIPSSVKHIDWFAFSGCTSLESITIPASVISVSYGAFDYCPKNMKIICPKGSYIEAYALSWGIAIITE